MARLPQVVPEFRVQNFRFKLNAKQPRITRKAVHVNQLLLSAAAVSFSSCAEMHTVQDANSVPHLESCIHSAASSIAEH